MSRLKSPSPDKLKAPAMKAAVADVFNSFAELILLQETKINDLGADIHGMRVSLGDFGDGENEKIPAYVPVTAGLNFCEKLNTFAEDFAKNPATAANSTILSQIEAAKDFIAAQGREIRARGEILLCEDMRDRNRIEKHQTCMPMNYQA